MSRTANAYGTSADVRVAVMPLVHLFRDVASIIVVDDNKVVYEDLGSTINFEEGEAANVKWYLRTSSGLQGNFYTFLHYFKHQDDVHKFKFMLTYSDLVTGCTTFESKDCAIVLDGISYSQFYIFADTSVDEIKFGIPVEKLANPEDYKPYPRIRAPANDQKYAYGDRVAMSDLQPREILILDSVTVRYVRWNNANQITFDRTGTLDRHGFIAPLPKAP